MTACWWSGSGGWRPEHGAAIGVAFTVDAAGALLGCFAALLTTLSLLYASRYFKAVGTRFHALMLLFLGAVGGFVSSGDLFNLFVFFELMGVAAFALTGYRSRSGAPPSALSTSPSPTAWRPSWCCSASRYSTGGPAR